MLNDEGDHQKMDDVMPMKTRVHPGEIIREDVITYLNLSVTEAAQKLGVSRVALSRVVNGHARVSANLALRLEAAGVSTARAWLAIQIAYDLSIEAEHGLPTVEPLAAASTRVGAHAVPVGRVPGRTTTHRRDEPHI